MSLSKKARVDWKQNLYEFALQQSGTNLAKRHKAPTCQELDSIDANEATTQRLRPDKSANKRLSCYPCGRQCWALHPVYIYSCFECGELSSKMRCFSRPLVGHVALVTGARSKLGHQIVLKLLRAGSTVLGMTRFPQRAATLFENYADAAVWREKLHWIECDFDCESLTPKIDSIMQSIAVQFGFISILINNAAQTIRVREKQMLQPAATVPAAEAQESSASSSAHFGGSESKKNRYGDGQSVPSMLNNSWQQTPLETDESEYIECYRVNALAPAIICKCALPLMQKSTLEPYIINVHAREGLIHVRKSPFHVHTNMAKAALHMLTKGLVSQKYRTESGDLFRVHGCDPGWISVDEYYAESLPYPCAPLDERDGAARILYPVFAKLDACSVTRRHFYTLEH